MWISTEGEGEKEKPPVSCIKLSMHRPPILILHFGGKYIMPALIVFLYIYILQKSEWYWDLFLKQNEGY